MARIRRTSEERIAALESEKNKALAKIETEKAKIAKINASIANLSKKQKQKEMDGLLEAIKTSGKTPEEFLAEYKASLENVG